MLKYYENVTPEDMFRAFQAQYLTSRGWTNSVETMEAIDQHGPVPWYTYPALSVLKQIIKPQYRVFEYGSGNSSLWWGHRVTEVISVEHDSAWADQVRSQATARNTIHNITMGAPIDPEDEAELEKFFSSGLAPAPGPDEGQNFRAGLLSEPFKAYASQLLKHPHGYFDIIVVDGMARVMTAWLAGQYVKPGGFIIFDNSDRDFYQQGYDILIGQGFTRIDFWGPGPINPYEWCTSIFTKTLDIFR